ncbi:Protein kri1 [Fusarium oxysporum f. sp. raphani]|uniref:Protein kri1 n=1 Tax=Fusarium oxysporum f. sp. raphani TaxID=96318 RepID=A0A8J5TMV4_FUSOX|nr:Protein kri1 [Fusarium oxysporum f. sp. raphani]
MARLKKLKLDEAQEKLRKIKRTAGSAGKDLTDEDWIKFLDDAWEDDKGEEMKKRFLRRRKEVKNPKKPKWDDDIDIKDLIPDFEDDEEKPEISLSDVEDGAAEEKDDEEDEGGRLSKKRKTDHKKARKESQKQARQERAKLEALVDSKLELSDHALLKQPYHAPFRYRETSPQSFGMTVRDILLAPSDAALNDYAGLKKLATFHDQEKKRKRSKARRMLLPPQQRRNRRTSLGTF